MQFPAALAQDAVQSATELVTGIATVDILCEATVGDDLARPLIDLSSRRTRLHDFLRFLQCEMCRAIDRFLVARGFTADDGASEIGRVSLDDGTEI